MKNKKNKTKQADKNWIKTYSYNIFFSNIIMLNFYALDPSHIWSR